MICKRLALKISFLNMALFLFYNIDLRVGQFLIGFPGSSEVMNLSVMQQTQVQSLGQEDPLEKGMATHSSILAWRILWTEEPGRLQSRESLLELEYGI